MSRVVFVGADALLRFGVEPLLKRGEITPEQYSECVRRVSLLPENERGNKVVLS